MNFGHGNIIKYCNRPFLMDEDRKALKENGGTWHNGTWKGSKSSNWRISRDAVDLMNDVLTDNINNIVGENDILWHLGDFAFAPRENYVHKCEFYRRRIKCKNVNIVWGNHDNRSINYLFDGNYDQIELEIDRQLIVLNHYALACWNKSHRGSIALHGHSHSEAEPWLDKHMPGHKSMDVGVDNVFKLFGQYRPISLEEILTIMATRSGHNLGDHHINPNAPEE